MPVFSIVTKTRYEICADDDMQATQAAIAVAAGCNDDRAALGERRKILGCLVQPEGSEVLSTIERKTAAQIVAEHGVDLPKA